MWDSTGQTSSAQLWLPNSAALTPIMTRPGRQPFYTVSTTDLATSRCKTGTTRWGRGLMNPNNNNWGPRIGLAYTPAEHWSIRAGFGIFYVQDIGNTAFDMARNGVGKT